MIFTSYEYLIFIVVIFAGYWLLRAKTPQNLLLLVGSYVFYGYIHPWFCILIATSTVVDYFCGLGMMRAPQRKKWFLVLSLICNLGMLGVFKYFNFFAENVHAVATELGLGMDPIIFKIFLPVGISFYTFQTLSYTIDIYRGLLKPRRNFIDFALFVAFFPQLVAGPIERAVRFLPQIEMPRRWDWERFCSAWPLLVGGYLKKMVIADNMAFFTDKVYMHQDPSVFLLFAGTVAFAVQILADFSAYTDIARGSARLIGFELIENFRSPYLAISPSDFWRRWHISFSTWIRDYLYIPLGGSRVSTKGKFLLVLIGAMGLSGLWHGAAWNFVLWGIYHAFLIFGYHALGFGGRWRPKSRKGILLAWVAMCAFTLGGWMLFRCTSMGWLYDVLTSGNWGFTGDSLLVSLSVLLLVLAYSLPMQIMLLLDHKFPQKRMAHAIFYGLALLMIVMYAPDTNTDFIYFQF